MCVSDYVTCMLNAGTNIEMQCVALANLSSCFDDAKEELNLTATDVSKCRPLAGVV